MPSSSGAKCRSCGSVSRLLDGMMSPMRASGVGRKPREDACHGSMVIDASINPRLRNTGGVHRAGGGLVRRQLVVPEPADVAAAGLAVGALRGEPDDRRIHDVDRQKLEVRIGRPVGIGVAGPARQQRIDGDAGAGQIGGEDQRRGFERGLGDAIGRVAALRQAAEAGVDVDDPAPAVPDQMRRRPRATSGTCR